MKFRYKVLLINILVLSIGIGTVGFFMIHKNYQLALDSQVKNTIEENNLFQSIIEYQMLDAVNKSTGSLDNEIYTIGSNVISNLGSGEACIYIVYGDKMVYASKNDENMYPTSLCSDAQIGSKQYIIENKDDTCFIYAASCNTVLNKNLYIINRRNITPVYDLMYEQQRYFQMLLLAVLIICSIFMFVISMLLTRPLEKLNQTSASFGNGNYSVRSNIKSNDEIGELAKTYNTMAASVEQHVEDLNYMVKRQEQFVADFTHEIKTPMTTIIGYADTLRSKELSRENQIMAASYIFSEGKRLENMSMKLFDFLYTKNHEIEKKPVNVHKLMDEIYQSVNPGIEKSNLTLISTPVDETIYADSDLLKSAYINIIDNARKASSPGACILFGAAVDGSDCTIFVRDYGIGISEENIERICDEFFMVDKSRSRKEGGAGLGLSLAFMIFKSHGSTLNIESALGKGTTMSATFSTEKDSIEKEAALNEK